MSNSIISNSKTIIRQEATKELKTTHSTANIKVRAGFNTGASPRWLKYDFGVIQEKIIVHKAWGDNNSKMLVFENVSSITLNGNPEEDGNGTASTSMSYHLHFWLSNPEDIVSMVWSSNSANNRTAFGKLQLDSSFINLEYFYVSRADSLGVTSFNQSKVTHLPKLKYLILDSDNPTLMNNLRFNESTSLRVYKNLKESYSTDWIFGSIKYLNCRYINSHKHFEIDSFFNNGVRSFLNIGTYFNGAAIGNILYGMRYYGNAIFPKHITDSDIPLEIPEYIIYLANNHFLVEPLTPDELSQLIIDFANQVESIDVLNKKIRLQGLTPNTSYEDLSQPLFTTYTSALAHITDTLGITVSFT